MTVASRISAHIPLLRRHARALVGSQEAGDSAVELVLERLVEDPGQFPDTGSDRVSLFKFFSQCMQEQLRKPRADADAPEWERNVVENLAGVPTLARQAFLLTALENFSSGEVAAILDVTNDEVDELLSQAAAAISRQVATEILIIEDEPLIALEIEQLARDLGHDVVGIARTHDETRDLVAKNEPKLIIADIQLADGSSGIEAVNELLGDREVPVVFITAFPERLLTGSKPEPTFLVTKPYHPDMVKAIINQALFFDDRAKAAA